MTTTEMLSRMSSQEISEQLAFDMLWAEWAPPGPALPGDEEPTRRGFRPLSEDEMHAKFRAHNARLMTEAETDAMMRAIARRHESQQSKEA